MRKALDVYSLLKDNNLSYELIYTLIIINNFRSTETLKKRYFLKARFSFIIKSSQELLKARHQTSFGSLTPDFNMIGKIVEMHFHKKSGRETGSINRH